TLTAFAKVLTPFKIRCLASSEKRNSLLILILLILNYFLNYKKRKTKLFNLVSFLKKYLS
ncbi:MAG: hypothetical protein KDD45_06905, partial [Bdellovibrionales bacterium]|nr:hypothetical protein [Bdellovibrionales bacterium]